MQFYQFLLQYVGNNAKGRISKRGMQENKARIIFQKLTGAKNVMIVKNVKNVLIVSRTRFTVNPHSIAA